MKTIANRPRQETRELPCGVGRYLLPFSVLRVVEYPYNAARADALRTTLAWCGSQKHWPSCPLCGDVAGCAGYARSL